jgi:hypothetical protein
LCSRKNNFNLFAYVSIKTKDGTPLAFLKNEKVLACLVGEKQDLLSYFNIEESRNRQDQKKINFIGEIAEELYNKIKQDKTNEIALTHVREIIFEMLRNEEVHEEQLQNIEINIVKASTKYGANKDRLKVSPFILPQLEAEKAIISHENGIFLLIGDALKTPDYRTGRGLNSIFPYLELLRQLLFENITLEEYNQKHQSIAQQTNKVVAEFDKKEWASMFKTSTKALMLEIKSLFASHALSGKHEELVRLMLEDTEYVAKIQNIIEHGSFFVSLTDQEKTSWNAFIASEMKTKEEVSLGLV